jgi:hypothetical protein
VAADHLRQVGRKSGTTERGRECAVELVICHGSPVCRKEQDFNIS